MASQSLQNMSLWPWFPVSSPTLQVQISAFLPDAPDYPVGSAGVYPIKPGDSVNDAQYQTTWHPPTTADSTSLAAYRFPNTLAKPCKGGQSPPVPIRMLPLGSIVEPRMLHSNLVIHQDTSVKQYAEMTTATAILGVRKQSCSQASTSLTADQDTLYKRRDGGKVRHRCDVCSATFTRKHDLRRHLALHSTESAKAFKCTLCSRAFPRADALKRHLDTRGDHNDGTRRISSKRSRRYFDDDDREASSDVNKQREEPLTRHPSPTRLPQVLYSQVAAPTSEHASFRRDGIHSPYKVFRKLSYLLSDIYSSRDRILSAGSMTPTDSVPTSPHTGHFTMRKPSIPSGCLLSEYPHGSTVFDELFVV